MFLSRGPFDDAAEGDRGPSRYSVLRRQKLPEIHIPERRGAWRRTSGGFAFRVRMFIFFYTVGR